MDLRGKTRMGIFARYGYLIENIVSYKKNTKRACAIVRVVLLYAHD